MDEAAENFTPAADFVPTDDILVEAIPSNGDLPPAKQVRMDSTDAGSNRKRSNSHLVSQLRASISKSADNLASPVTPTANRFSILAGVDDVPTMPSLTPKPRPRPRAHQKSVPPTVQPVNHEADQIKTKRERVPTITIKWPISRVYSEMKVANISQKSFTLTQVNGNGGTLVKMSTLNEYDSFLKRCVDFQLPHFTHPVDARKPVRIVLLGLPDVPIEELKAALADLNITPDDIRPMKIRNKRYLEHNNYILYFPKGSITANRLREVKSICSVVVRWAYYDAKRHGPTQCRRCQEYGHGSSNCHLPPACVKCAGPHETSTCTHSKRGEKVPEELLKCANCQQKHSANFGGCSSRKTYIDSRPKRQTPRIYNNRGAQPSTNQRPVHQPAPSGNRRPAPQFRNMTTFPAMPTPQGYQQPAQYLQPPQHQQPPQQQFSANYSDQASSKLFENCQDSFTPDQLLELIEEIIPICNSGLPKFQQFKLAFKLAAKYSAGLDGRP